MKRRNVLKTVGAGIGIGAIGLPGTAAASGHRGRGADPCPDCGSLLAKYEWNEDDGAFAFEKGRDTLGIDGDEFDITVTETNDDGEPLCIKVDSIEHPNSGAIYDFTCSTVKSGQDVDTETYDGWVSGFNHCQEKYAISNFALCINDVYWQWDWGTGPAKDLNTEDPDDRRWYQADSNDDRWLLAADRGHGDADADPSWEALDASLVTNVAYRVVDSSTVAIDFDVVGDDPLDLHVTSQELPGPGTNDEIPWGPMYDIVEGTYAGDGNTMTVDLPTL